MKNTLTTMKAIQFATYGGPDVLQLADTAMPTIGEDDVLIRVHAAGVNPADIQLRRGDYRTVLPLALPFVAGADVSGTVSAVGSRVSQWRAGDKVFAMTEMHRQGGYAEFVAMHASALAPAPASLSLETSAGVPLAALTAWMALFDHAKVGTGTRVLVHAGAGGVGLFAIQLARRAGAHVIATASAANHPLLRELGAHDVIDYRSTDFAEGLRDIDVVLDTVGGETRERSWATLVQGGLQVAIAMPPPDGAAAQARGLRTSMVAVSPNGQRLAEIGRLIDAGELKMVIDSEFPLAQAAEAHRRVEQRHARGKVVLRVA